MSGTRVETEARVGQQSRQYSAIPVETVPPSAARGRSVVSGLSLVGILGLVVGMAVWALCASGWPGSWQGGRTYGFLVGMWLFLQIIFAHAEWRRQGRATCVHTAAPVTVVIPTYNEPCAILRECVRSVLQQQYEGDLEIIVVDDGSEGDSPDLNDLYALTSARRTLRYQRLPRNQGKRHAQALGFQAAKGEFVVTMDSDTRLDPEAIGRAMCHFVEPSVGAVTGVALVDNQVSLLTRLIHLRYWSAFYQERASQSYFGLVVCCSGVFAIYRKELIDELLERYVSQRFLGRPCRYGDDRHLTNLVLWKGYEVRLAMGALAWTQAPMKLAVWLRQQLRWSKSFYRELLWSLRFAHRKNLYFAYCLVFQAVLPLLLVYGLTRGGMLVWAGHWEVAVRYGIAVMLMAWLRGAYGLWRSREPRFLLMPLYGFLHITLVLPIRVLALFTLWDNRWGTR